jgi:hypothetical protein
MDEPLLRVVPNEPLLSLLQFQQIRFYIFITTRLRAARSVSKGWRVDDVSRSQKVKPKSEAAGG